MKRDTVSALLLWFALCAALAVAVLLTAIVWSREGAATGTLILLLLSGGAAFIGFVVRDIQR